jgi:hypothetical protein
VIQITDHLSRTIETAIRLIGFHPVLPGARGIRGVWHSACDKTFCGERKKSNHEDDEARNPDRNDRARIIPDRAESVVGVPLGQVKKRRRSKAS